MKIAPKQERKDVAKKVCGNIQSEWPMTDAEKKEFAAKHTDAKRYKKNDCIDW